MCGMHMSRTATSKLDPALSSSIAAAGVATSVQDIPQPVSSRCSIWRLVSLSSTTSADLPDREPAGGPAGERRSVLPAITQVKVKVEP